MTFKLREACTKLAQMLWPPWVGAALMMKKLYEGDKHSLASVEEACAQKRAQKAENISKGALSSLLESWETHYFLTTYKPQVVPEESCVAADFWQ